MPSSSPNTRLDSSAVIELGLPCHDGLIVSCSQDLAPVISNKDSVFELSTALAVSGNCRPIISPGSVLVGSQVYHGFDGKDMALLHYALGLVLIVVGNIRRRVEETSNSMTAIRPINCASIRHSRLVDNTTKVAIQCTRLDLGESRCKTIKCRFDQLLAIRIHISNAERFCREEGSIV